MARKKDKTMGYILIGIAAFLLLRPQNKYNAYQQFPQAPPQPPTKGQAFAQWVNTILALYGNVKELWEPGGPFYGVPAADVKQAVDNPAGSGGYYDYSDPYSMGPEVYV